MLEVVSEGANMIRAATATMTLVWMVSCVHGADIVHGWRGNGTGLWPDAKPTLEWSRTRRGPLQNLRHSTTRPKDKDPGEAKLVEKGLVRDWLLIGPFAVDDSIKDFDRDHLGGEEKVEPNAGDKVGERVWTAVAATPDDIMVFGTAELAYCDFTKTFEFKPNQVGYACTYLHSPRGGPARIVVDHGHGLKVWLNGKQVYRSPGRGVGLGYYTSLSRNELEHREAVSPQFDLELQPGWNRLLLKLSTSNKYDFKDMRCCLRLMDPLNVVYDSKNIIWMTPLPARSTSTPIMTTDRLFVMAEPDELLCLDKQNGKILWSAFVNYYETVTDAEKKAEPRFAKNVDPLVESLRKETDRSKRTRLRGEIRKALLEIDAERFTIKGSGHFESHFGIVGFTMPTPLSDGKHVYVWSGMGVAVCFDLDGKRQWITRVQTDELNYGSSPALADGVFVVFLNGLFGLDAKTGKLVWKQPKIRYNVAAIQAAKYGDQSVIVTQRGDLIRPSDGELLFRQKGSSSSGDTGWAPPTLIGNQMYLPKYGVTHLDVFDCGGLTKDNTEPKLEKGISLPGEVSRLPGNKWIDRWSAGSPLIHDGYSYMTDIYQNIYVVELKTGKMVYRQELAMHGLTHYNAVAVAASPTLIGKHIAVCDNQGTTVLLEPGPTFKMVAKNRIETQMERKTPIPAQETLTYSPPLAEGGRIYLRGEGYLYCIGEK